MIEKQKMKEKKTCIYLYGLNYGHRNSTQCAPNYGRHEEAINYNKTETTKKKKEMVK